MAVTSSPPAGEMQSALSLADYVAMLERHRRWLVLGLLIVMAITFVMTKFASLKFYKAESQFYLNNRAYSNQPPGISDAKVMDITQSGQFETAVNAVLADRFLNSTEILTSATQMLLADPGRYDLYGLLQINEKNPEIRHAILMQELRGGLIHVKPVQATGLVEYTAELPHPVAAARFVNISLDLLQRKFVDLNFGYFARLRDLDELQLTTTTQLRKTLANELRDFQRKHGFDTIESLAQQRLLLQEKLKEVTLRVTQLTQRIESLKMATSLDALRAAQPVFILNPAEVPLKKSRPQTILTTAVAGVLYLFVFLTALMLVGMWRTLRRAT